MKEEAQKLISNRNVNINWSKIIEFSARFILVIIALIVAFYVASSNWDWYVDELELEKEHPKWANPSVNWYLVVLFYGLLAITWNRHHFKHKEQMKIDLFYPVAILLLFITFTLFFEQRNFKLSRWFGILTIVNLGIILYDSFFIEAIVSGLVIVELSILIYLVSQVWYFSKVTKKSVPQEDNKSGVFWSV